MPKSPYREIDGTSILILGAGPAGLGAAHRLSELGYADYRLCEGESYAGGLAASFTDARGFTWDIGGHVQFSHYRYFDALMDSLLGDDWLTHERESWIHVLDRMVPYPFQLNIHRLPDAEMQECLRGLERCAAQPGANPPDNFAEWIEARFGAGIARLFMVPYNLKVWGTPLDRIGTQWMGERVPAVDLDRVRRNIRARRDDVGWGPNATFRFPLHGGTGEIWRRSPNP